MTRCTRSLSLGLLAAGALLSVGSVARAHTRSQSFSTWDVRGPDVTVVFSVNAVEATRLASGREDAPNLDALLRAHLTSRLRVARGDAPCIAATPQTLAARPGLLRVEQHFRCAESGPLRITDGAFFDLVPSHIHMARVRIGDDPSFELLFSESRRERTMGAEIAGPGAGATFGSWVRLGVEHIAAGADHIAFLLALLLLCRRLRDVAWLVTGFTLGHSATLTLAVLGVVKPNVPVVEALIGFTIALVAAENVAARASAVRFRVAVGAAAGLLALALLRVATGIGLPASASLGLAVFALAYLPLAANAGEALRLRPLLTLLFGFVHGFGFASVLLEVGLPAGRLASALIGFNLGVEIGQLVIVALLWSVGTWLARRAAGLGARRLAVDLLSALLCGLGLFWFVQRSFGA